MLEGVYADKNDKFNKNSSEVGLGNDPKGLRFLRFNLQHLPGFFYFKDVR